MEIGRDVDIPESIHGDPCAVGQQELHERQVSIFDSTFNGCPARAKRAPNMHVSPVHHVFPAAVLQNQARDLEVVLREAIHLAHVVENSSVLCVCVCMSECVWGWVGMMM